MIKTFIYGNPHGFDFYEKDSTYNDYVKGFYISSRKGRRMMVNRRENGETTYNYLRYGLHEAIDRPTNAFFGMTLVVGGSLYCADFKKILEWFDYMFERIVKEKNIFLKNEHGDVVTPLKYRIHKFEEGASDIEWIESNLPNIFSSAAGTALTAYDSTFISGKTGQVAGVNDKESANNILKMFKRYSWIALSQQYSLLPVGGDQNVSGVAELNYTDLKSKIDDFNKRLVPIATGVNEGTTEELSEMDKESRESFGLLAGYLKNITDDEEKVLFNALTRDYHSFVESISALLAKRVNRGTDKSFTDPVVPKTTQFCFNCKQEKDPSHFSSPAATKCIECEEEEKREERKTKKQCIKCGKYKPFSHFGNGGNICQECQEQEAPQTKTCRHCGRKKPLADFPLNSDTCYECSHSIDWNKIIHNSLYPLLGVVALFAIIGCLYWYITSDSEKGKSSQQEEQTEVVEKHNEEKSDEDKKVSVAMLNQYLADEDFTGAYQYISDKNDKASHFITIANAIDKHFWNVIESSGATGYESIKTQLELEIRPINSLLNDIGLENGYLEKILQGAKDFTRLQAIITKLKITEAEYNEGCKLLSAIGEKLANNWQEALETKWTASKTLVKNEDKKDDTNVDGVTAKTEAKDVEITVERFDADDKTSLGSTNLAKAHNGVEGNVNTFVVINAHGTKISFGTDCPFQNHRISSDKVKVKLIKEGSYTYKCGTKDITITAKKTTNKPGRH